MLETLAGNQEFKQSLLTALSSGRLSHSVLLVGEKGTGVNFAAKLLAADYLYPSNKQAANAVLKGEGAECISITGEGASGDIKIDAVRQMRKEIFNTSISAQGRCVIIRDAQHLNATSANALLKILEEPPENVLFILTAPSEAAIMATIRSRCAIFSLCGVSEKECIDVLCENGIETIRASKLTELFEHKIGTALKAHKNEEDASALTKAENIYKFWQENDEFSIGAVFTEYEKDKPLAHKLLWYLQCVFAAAMRKQNINAARVLPHFHTAATQLNRNASPKLVFATLAANLCG